MAVRTLSMTDSLHAYLLGANEPLPPVQQRLRDETALLPQGGWQISAEQGQFMAFLVKLTGAKHCLEVGVFTGFSSLVVAQALPPDGTILALDVSEEFTSVARRYWQEANVTHKIVLRLAPATQTLAKLADSPENHAAFDFAFIDADKPNYDSYYESCLTLLRVGGLLLIDNVLWAGKVADPTITDADTMAFKNLNAKIATDERVDRCMVPIGDGVTLCRKR
ncbi:MAG: class I SAM-dependent methyltransferase [Akkermansiaceae bacterium]|nr:class I SAM-dependent methyltransferase [Armatimonadota bacterium]